MPCRFARDGALDPSERKIDRGTFFKSALVIGGAEALATAVDRHGDPEDLNPDSPYGVERKNRQFAWKADDSRGPPPHFHLLLHLDYQGDDPEQDRETVEAALQDLEETFGWKPAGLVFTLGYSRSYFERVDGSVPEPLQQSVHAEPAVATDGGSEHDALLHLASHDPRKMLAAESALWGEETVVDVDLGETFEGVFSRPMAPPARRAAMDGSHRGTGEDDAAFPAGAGVSDVPGGTVQRVSTFSPEDVEFVDEDGDEGHHHGDDGGHHGEEGEDYDPGDHSDSDGHDHGEGYDRSDREEGIDDGPTGVRKEIYGLNPGDPAPVRVDLAGPDADLDPAEDARGHELYYVPPVAARSLPSGS